MHVGEVYRHRRFYADARTGALLPKYLLVLALPKGGDVIARLLTSEHPDVRPVDPPCHHGPPYPGFYMGVPGDPLLKKTWLDLRQLDDLDADEVAVHLRKGILELVLEIQSTSLRAAMECAARADDTPLRQERAILDARAAL